MTRSNRFLGIIFAVISAISFGFIPLVASIAYRDGIQTNTLLFLMFTIGALILWTIILIKKIPFKLSLSHLAHVGLISILGYTLSSTAYFNAFKYIPSSLATIITFLFPVFVVGYEMVASRKLVKSKIIALLITTLGLYLIVGVWNSDLSLNPLGISFALLSAISYAIYCVGAGEKRTRKLNSLVLSAYIMTFCSLAYMIICLFVCEPLLPATSSVFIWIIILAIVCGIFPIIFLAASIKIIGAGNASIASAFEPLASCLIGVLILGETLTSTAIIGGVLIVLSIISLEVFKDKNEDNTHEVTV